MTRRTKGRPYTCLEICAGAGGQALGLENAGFRHVALIEMEADACLTLRANRPEWNVIEQDVREFKLEKLTSRVDLLSGGVPCPPYSIAGARLGRDDERDLFPEVLRYASILQPRGIMIENVKGVLQRKFDDYRREFLDALELLGYTGSWRILNASDYGVPQLRPRSVLVALRTSEVERFQWPLRVKAPPTVGNVLRASMGKRGWKGASAWAERADSIGPTLVGGSKKHGGADLGPSRAKEAWIKLGVDAMGLADEVPTPGFSGHPRLTVEQAARLQGFPSKWRILGRKTSAYRQVGNAFPPPVAEAVGKAIARAWSEFDKAQELLNRSGRCKGDKSSRALNRRLE